MIDPVAPELVARSGGGRPSKEIHAFFVPWRPVEILSCFIFILGASLVGSLAGRSVGTGFFLNQESAD